ncbi:unnamed protein product [Allacma fusca]|uniref:Methyltransferase small domain-containing protein n=1 Tax=Allacma fusca TaxID=39272 RepID=A0A8J2JHR0_9HEXA|nr:unnamed protein product [Allacma fusca]
MVTLSPRLLPRSRLPRNVNPSACLLAQATAEVNRVSSKVEPILMDGTVPIFRLPLFDIVVCNPPYVPVMPEEKFELSGGLVESYLEKSWDGGPDGNSFIIPFLKTVPKLLTKTGALYLLLSSWNEPENLMGTVALEEGLVGTMVIKRQAGRERLSVWRLVRANCSCKSAPPEVVESKLNFSL